MEPKTQNNVSAKTRAVVDKLENALAILNSLPSDIDALGVSNYYVAQANHIRMELNGLKNDVLNEGK